jgi:hypothetical protein
MILTPINNALNDKPLVTVALQTLPADALVYRRPEDLSRRALRVLFRQETARDFLGTIRPGMHLFGFSKGQFSLVELLEAITDQMAPIDFALSTWTAARADLTRLEQLVTSTRIRTIRLLIDATFQRREPQLLQSIRERYGTGAIRIVQNHAKFMLCSAGDLRLVVRTSMNLNFNPRLEDVEIKDDPEVYQFLDGILVRLFGFTDPARQSNYRPRDFAAEFARIE